MEISQKRGSVSTRYAFFDDRIDYAWKDSSGSRSFSVGYADVSRDRQTLTERNVWFRNAGALWLIIGGAQLAMTWGAEGGARGGFWLLLGAACVAWYALRPVNYLIIPSDKGNLLVLDDADGARVMEEIQRRRAAYYRDEYDFFPESETPQQLRNRFTWLHREGALTEPEMQARLAEVDKREHAPESAEGASPPRLLN